MVKLLPHSSMIGMIFERDIHYRVVESKNHGLLQHDPFSWLVKDDHFVDVGDIYESQKIMNEALNEWILSLNEEQVPYLCRHTLSGDLRITGGPI